MTVRHTPQLNIHVQGWLLALPAVVLLATFTHVPAVATVIDSFFSTPHGEAARRVHRPRSIPQHAGRPGLLAGLQEQSALRADHGTDRDRPGARRWRSGSMATSGDGAALRLAFFTPTILPMVAAANIWLFFYTPDYGLLNQVFRGLRLRQHQLARQSRDRAAGADGGDDLEGGRLLHDLLSGGAAAGAADLYEAARMENAGRWQVFRRITWPLVMPTTLFVAVNALINAFRVVDQVDRDDRRRAEQRHHLAAVLHLSRSPSASGTPPTRPRCRPCCCRARHRRVPAILHPRSQDPLSLKDWILVPMDPGKFASTTAAWLFGLIWALPLLVCDLGRVPPVRIRDAFRSACAAHAGKLRARLDRGAVRPLFPQHHCARDRHHGARSSSSARLPPSACPLEVLRQRDVVRPHPGPADGDAGCADPGKLPDAAEVRP